MTHHILVVEDNVSTRELYVDILEAYDFKVEVLQNGQEVLDYFDAPDKPRPDLLMLDINLPEKNGVYVLKYLRGKLKLHTQKILVITANHIAGQMPEMELANHIMTKPFLPKQLKETIDMVLNAPDRDIEVLITGETEPVVIAPAEAEATPEDSAPTITSAVIEPDPAPEIDPHKADTVETNAIPADEADIIDDVTEEETAKADPAVVESVVESDDSEDESAKKIDTTDRTDSSNVEAITVETEPVSSETTPETSAEIAKVEEKAG
ncbi:MAG: response regulator [Aggregatilineales bacterium]